MVITSGTDKSTRNRKASRCLRGPQHPRSPPIPAPILDTRALIPGPDVCLSQAYMQAYHNGPRTVVHTEGEAGTFREVRLCPCRSIPIHDACPAPCRGVCGHGVCPATPVTSDSLVPTNTTLAHGAMQIMGPCRSCPCQTMHDARSDLAPVVMTWWPRPSLDPYCSGAQCACHACMPMFRVDLHADMCAQLPACTYQGCSHGPGKEWRVLRASQTTRIPFLA